MMRLRKYLCALLAISIGLAALHATTSAPSSTAPRRAAILSASAWSSSLRSSPSSHTATQAHRLDVGRVSPSKPVVALEHTRQPIATRARRHNANARNAVAATPTPASSNASVGDASSSADSSAERPSFCAVWSRLSHVERRRVLLYAPQLFFDAATQRWIDVDGVCRETIMLTQSNASSIRLRPIRINAQSFFEAEKRFVWGCDVDRLLWNAERLGVPLVRPARDVECGRVYVPPFRRLVQRTDLFAPSADNSQPACLFYCGDRAEVSFVPTFVKSRTVLASYDLALSSSDVPPQPRATTHWHAAPPSTLHFGTSGGVLLRSLNAHRHWGWVGKIEEHRALARRYPFAKKRDVLLWRGCDTGPMHCSMADHDCRAAKDAIQPLVRNDAMNEFSWMPQHAERASRMQLVKLWAPQRKQTGSLVAFKSATSSRAPSGFVPDPRIDVSLTHFVKSLKHERLFENFYVQPRLGVNVMYQYRFLLSTEGNDVASGLKWMLFSNSVVVMPPPAVESWLLESSLVPFKHYIPVARDFSNLTTVFTYCAAQGDACRSIADAATDYMLPFVNMEREKIVENAVVRAYAERVRFDNLDRDFLHGKARERECVVDKS